MSSGVVTTGSITVYGRQIYAVLKLVGDDNWYLRLTELSPLGPSIIVYGWQIYAVLKLVGEDNWLSLIHI